MSTEERDADASAIVVVALWLALLGAALTGALVARDQSFGAAGASSSVGSSLASSRAAAGGR